MLRLRFEALLFAGLGIISGASFGWEYAWVVIQVCLTLFVLVLLHEKKGSLARREILACGLFCAGMVAAGHAGAAWSATEAVRGWAIGVDAVVAVAHGAAAAAFAWLARAWVKAPAVRFLLALPAAWVAREWLSMQIEFTVPWLAIGHAQAPHGPLAGLFPIGGVLLVGLAAMVLASATALAVQAISRNERTLYAAVAAAIVLAAVGAGQVAWTEPGSRLSVAVVQSGLRSADKFDELNGARVLQAEADAITATRAQLVITPQLAIPKTAQALPPGYLEGLHAVLQARGADALIGMYFSAGGENEFYNGVASLGASGPQRYLKHHLFPFGEYLPLGRLAGAVRAWLPTPMADTARAPVAEEPLFAAGMRVALAICYESAFGDTLRRQAGQAQMVVNVASDSALDSRQLARQFVQVNQARALELQKPLVRSSDIRGSYVIDERGRLAQALPEGVPAVLEREMQGRTGLTPYARFGDALAISVVLLAISICVLHPMLKRSTPSRHAPVLPTGPLRRQRGQVLPVSIAFMLIIAALFYFMVNTGQAVTEKMRVTNAADAAAYSAGVIEARALNYDAYLNRAMVANQMAIAQMVSFASWIDYFATAADNIGSTSGDINWFMAPDPRIIPLEGAFAGSAFVAAYFGGRTVSDYAAYVIDGAGAIITAHDVAGQALALSQRLVQLNLTAGVRQRDVANKVAKAMDPSMKAEVVLVSHGFDTFTKNYAGDDRARFADVAVRSRDQFTRERNWTINGFDIPLVRRDPSLKKRGGTDLIGFDEWRGVDTLELHGRRFGCGRFGLSWCDDIRKPIGWGGIFVETSGSDRGAGHHGNAYKENANTASNSDSVMRQPDYAYFTGIPTSQEIADTSSRSEPSTGITIRVWKKQADTLTSGGAAQLKPSGSLALFDDKPASGDMVGLSRAQVFFDRISARADGKSEIGSLYNPYWRVRLVAPTTADKAYAAARQGGLGLP